MTSDLPSDKEFFRKQVLWFGAALFVLFVVCAYLWVSQRPHSASSAQVRAGFTALYSNDTCPFEVRPMLQSISGPLFDPNTLNATELVIDVSDTGHSSVWCVAHAASERSGGLSSAAIWVSEKESNDRGTPSLLVNDERFGSFSPFTLKSYDPSSQHSTWCSRFQGCMHVGEIPDTGLQVGLLLSGSGVSSETVSLVFNTILPAVRSSIASAA